MTCGQLPIHVDLMQCSLFAPVDTGTELRTSFISNIFKVTTSYHTGRLVRCRGLGGSLHAFTRRVRCSLGTCIAMSSATFPEVVSDCGTGNCHSSHAASSRIRDWVQFPDSFHRRAKCATVLLAVVLRVLVPSRRQLSEAIRCFVDV